MRYQKVTMMRQDVSEIKKASAKIKTHHGGIWYHLCNNILHVAFDRFREECNLLRLEIETWMLILNWFLPLQSWIPWWRADVPPEFPTPPAGSAPLFYPEIARRQPTAFLRSGLGFWPENTNVNQHSFVELIVFQFIFFHRLPHIFNRVGMQFYKLDVSGRNRLHFVMKSRQCKIISSLNWPNRARQHFETSKYPRIYNPNSKLGAHA